MSSSYIRTSTHTLKFANQHKLEDLTRFIQEYRRIAKVYLDHLWDSGISWKVKNKTYHFDADTHLDHPKMLSTVEINKTLNLTTFLTQRALKCCITQVCGIIGATIGKQRKRQYVVNQKRAHHQKIPRKLRKATRINKPSKPDISRLNPELNSLCAQFEETNSHFDGFIQFHSLFGDRRAYKVNVPVKYTQTSKKWSHKGVLKTSFLLTDKDVQFRWEVKKKLKKRGRTVGADQGLKTVLTLSDRQITPKVDNHNHSLESITRRLSRRRKGSKRFKRTQDHRTNFVNWSINTLNLKGVRQINLENIRNINYKKKSCRYVMNPRILIQGLGCDGTQRHKS